MRKILALAISFVLCFSVFAVLAPIGSVAETVFREVGYSSPAICADAEETVDLSLVKVQFTDGGELISGDRILWKSGEEVITSYTPAAKGVYPLTATSGNLERTVYVVAKNTEETEYVLYEKDFATDSNIEDLRVVEQAEGAEFTYDADKKAIYLNTRNAVTDGKLRVLLPSYLDDFGDAVFSAKIQVQYGSNSKYGALLYRVQNIGTDYAPYMQVVARRNIRLNNTDQKGLEITEYTADGKWNILQEGLVADALIDENALTVEVKADFCGSKTVYSLGCETKGLAEAVYLTETDTPYNTGAMGFATAYNGGVYIYSTKVTVHPDTEPTPVKKTVNVGFSSPAICTDAGTAVDFSLVNVQFEAAGEIVGAENIVWKNGETVITSYTPSAKGVYPLTAISGNLTRTVYVVAKNQNETEYVLYENDFSTEPDLENEFRVIADEGTTATYNADKTALFLDSRVEAESTVRVLLPSWLDAFGDAVFTANMQVNYAFENSNTRYGALIFRAQNTDTTAVPYLYALSRRRISATRGMELGEYKEDGSFNIFASDKTTETMGAKVIDLTVSFCGTKTEYSFGCESESMEDTVYLATENTPYTNGGIGMLATGSGVWYNSIKLTVHPDAVSIVAPSTLHNTRDPESNLALAPVLVTEVKTVAEMQNLATTLPAVAIMESAENSGEFGVSLDGSFVGIDAFCENITDRVIPAFRVDGEAEAAALGKWATELELCDNYVISSDPKLVSMARSECDRLYGMVEVTSFTDKENLRATVISAGARGVIFNGIAPDRKTVSYLQDRYLVTWQNVTASDISAVNAINNGVMGLVTPDVSATESCFTKYYSESTLTRTPEIIGHRGVPSLVQENSIAGALTAFEVGASMVECDIYIMKDGKLIVMHDATLDRTTNGTGNTEDQTTDLIKDLVIDEQSELDTQPIPLLDDYFKQFKDTDEVLVIELKNDNTAVAEPLVELIKEYGMEEQIVIISFYNEAIAAVRAIDPSISAQTLATSVYADEENSLNVTKEVVKKVVPSNTAWGPSQSRGTLGINYYNDLIARSISLWTYTVNNQTKFDEYFVSGIRGMTTNYSQWAGDYIDSFGTVVDKNGAVTLEAYNYRGEKVDPTAPELVVIGGEGSYDSESGTLTLDDTATGYFFSMSVTLSSGAVYNVVTPVYYTDKNAEAITGDADKNQKIDILDLVLAASLDMGDKAEADFVSANVTKDEVIDSEDLKEIRKIILS